MSTNELKGEFGNDRGCGPGSGSNSNMKRAPHGFPAQTQPGQPHSPADPQLCDAHPITRLKRTARAASDARLDGAPGPDAQADGGPNRD